MSFAAWYAHSVKIGIAFMGGCDNEAVCIGVYEEFAV